MNINFLFYIILYIILFNSFNISYIVIPFNALNKEKEKQETNENLNIFKFFQNTFESQIYAKINVGTPKNFLQINLRMNNHGLTLGFLCDNDLLYEESNYNINKSLTFYGDQNNKKYYTQNQWAFIGQDSFMFYSDIETKNEIILNNISFIYVPKDETNNFDKICGTLGLALNAHYYLTEEVNFIKILKKYGYINTFDFSFYFTSETEGKLIIGEEPHYYFPTMFNANNLRKNNVLLDGYSNSGWKIEFSQIYFNINDIKYKIKEGKTALFAIENNYIIGNKNYQKMIEDNFFKKYLDNNICYYEKINNPKYVILICNKDSTFDINSFPTLYLYHRIFNYTFELTKDELFLEKNNKYIFLIFFWEYGLNYFTLGKIFLRKYLFTFNIDSKSVGFYNVKFQEFKEKNFLTIFFTIFGLIIILIACIIGFFFARKIYNRSRKKRFNELREDYEYVSYIENDINYDNNDKNKIFVEIPNKS